MELNHVAQHGDLLSIGITALNAAALEFHLCIDRLFELDDDDLERDMPFSLALSRLCEAERDIGIAKLRLVCAMPDGGESYDWDADRKAARNR
jgi:hypothetical protein